LGPGICQNIIYVLILNFTQRDRALLSNNKAPPYHLPKFQNATTNHNRFLNFQALADQTGPDKLGIEMQDTNALNAPTFLPAHVDIAGQFDLKMLFNLLQHQLIFSLPPRGSFKFQKAVIDVKIRTLLQSQLGVVENFLQIRAGVFIFKIV